MSGENRSELKLKDFSHLNRWLESHEKEVRTEGYKSGLKQGRKDRLNKTLKRAYLFLWLALSFPMAWELQIKEYFVFSFGFFFIGFVLKSIIDYLNYMDNV